MEKNHTVPHPGRLLTAAGKSSSLFPTIALAWLVLAGSQISTCFAQGALNPPGAPAPTMKTLAQIEPRTPISSLPFTITSAGSYYVTTNLTGVTLQAGLSISSSGVTLDLGGFTVLGVAGSLNGIFITSTFSNIVVRNGTVSGWGGIGVNGYTSGFPRNVTYEHLSISANGNAGMDAEAGSIIRDCVIMNNGSDGIDSVGSLITGCIVRDNRLSGMNVSGSTIRSCVAQFNGTGINAEHTVVADCNIMSNATNGLTLGSNCQVINNRIADHQGNPGNAILINGSLNYIAENAIINNMFGLYGGTAGATNNCILQNRFLNSINTGLSEYNIFPTAEPAAASSFNFANTNSFVNIFFP